MKKLSLGLVAASAALVATSALAQNIAIVNGKGVPKSRVDALVSQVSKQSGQPVSPQLEKQAREEVVMREIFMQEAERRGLQRSPDYLQRMELMRQGLLINELFADEEKRHPITDKELKAEYDKLLAQSGAGKEYRARHILVEKEEDAKALIAKLKAGAKFEDLAKKYSKDAGSAENGGDLDWATPNTYVPEFSEAMVKLQKGQTTDVPVKSEHGWHVIRLEDVRENAPPPFEAVKPQIKQFVQQQRVAQFREDLRRRAKTDFKFSDEAAQPTGN